MVRRSGASWRRLLTPGWLVVHVVTLALGVAMVLLGRWQLDVSNRKHFDLQNFGYALQWWAFTAFVLLMWVRVVRDGLRRMSGRGDGTHSSDPGSQPAEPTGSAPKPVAYRRYVTPTPAAPVDAEHAAYNDYLTRLNKDAERKQS